jgi:hypothetical protein
MSNTIFIDSLKLFKGMITNPVKTFNEVKNGKHLHSVYTLFIISSLLPLFKSFSKVKLYNNYFDNEIISSVLTFFSIPQISWLFVFICFALFLLIIKLFCLLFLKKCNTKELILCFMSISSVGILLQIVIFCINLISLNYVPFLRLIAFLWVAYLSIVAIQSSQNTTFLKSLGIYLLSVIPMILTLNFIGTAPFLLWVTS